MGRSKTDKHLSLNDLAKVFGIKRETISYRLHHGSSLKEALETEPNSYMLDLVGQKFNRLTAKYRIPGSHTAGCKWHCICDCGNECDVAQSNLVTNRQQSCGCLNMENRHKKHKDCSNRVINGVKLLYRTADEITTDGMSIIHYMCECPACGKLFDARLGNIRSGNTTGCGCLRALHQIKYDLVDMDFEFCHVIKRLPNAKQPGGGSRVMYECKCVCGNIYTDWSFTILHGRSNCGCKYVSSLGELHVKEWLTSHRVAHSRQYWFDDLRGKRKQPLFFDFALYDETLNMIGLIEYQGEQHYHEVPHSIKDFGKRQREVTDPMKRKYCFEHNIPLFEIAYNEDINERCIEIYNMLYHDNTVPSSQETA